MNAYLYLCESDFDEYSPDSKPRSPISISKPLMISHLACTTLNTMQEFLIAHHSAII